MNSCSWGPESSERRVQGLFSLALSCLFDSGRPWALLTDSMKGRMPLSLQVSGLRGSVGRVGLQVLGGSWEAQAEFVVALRSQSREVHPQTCPRYFPWPTLAVSWGLSQSKARQASLLQASHAECVRGNRVFPCAGKSGAGRRKARMHEPASRERCALRLVFLLPGQREKGPVNAVDGHSPHRGHHVPRSPANDLPRGLVVPRPCRW